jgi:predicted MFS family arabinose efflux permease
MTAVAEERKEFIRESMRNRRLLGVAAIAAIGGFLFGYDTGVIGGAMLFMQKDLGLHSHGQQQLVVAILLLGAITGAFISGWLADAISRRRTKMVSGCVYVIGGIACALSRNYPEILASRFVLGLSVGTASFVSPMYIGELVPKSIRGGVVSFNQLMVGCTSCRSRHAGSCRRGARTTRGTSCGSTATATMQSTRRSARSRRSLRKRSRCAR